MSFNGRILIDTEALLRERDGLLEKVGLLEAMIKTLIEQRGFWKESYKRHQGMARPDYYVREGPSLGVEQAPPPRNPVSLDTEMVRGLDMINAAFSLSHLDSTR